MHAFKKTNLVMNPETINVTDLNTMPVGDLTGLGDGSVNLETIELSDAQAAAFGAAMIGFSLVMFVVGIAVYIYMGLCLFLIAKKKKEENAWFAWLPVLNFILMCQIAKKPLWWVLLLFVPFVNLVMAILLMVEFLKALGKPGWWVILMMIPVVNFVVWGILAFSKK
jgi:ABC-type Na+ efflux pump permease subunit